MLHTEGPGCDHCAALKTSLMGQGPVPMRDADRSLASDTDVLHYDLDITITPSSQNITGTNTITVRSLASSLVDFDINLSNTFSIPSVTVGGTPVGWVRLTPSLIRITLDRTYTLNEEFEVEIAYSGSAVGGGFGSITWTSAGGQPWVYTLSEPYYAYTWWPCKDVIADKATADLRFTVASNLEVASNGSLVSNTDNGNSTRTFHYATNYPTAPYLFAFGLGNYNFFSDIYFYSGGSMPMEFAILTGSDTPNNRAAWLKTKDMMPVFENLFGEYPWRNEKYGIYHFGFGGGMEHQTMSGQGTTNESVTAHELGHQWWGDMVTCDSWHHIWVNEGFATYSEALWEEHKTGVPNPVALRSAMAARKPGNFNFSVYVPTIESPSRIFDSNSSYRKGGWVLHMLRRKVGDTAFYQALDTFRAAHADATATTEDVRAAFETASGLDLETYFDQWIYYPGAPNLRYALRPLNIGGQHYAEIYLTQIQSATWPTYEIDVDVRVSTSGGAVDSTVPMSARTQHYLIPLDHPSNSASLDPNGWLLYVAALSTSFVEGPARVIATGPAPDATEDFGTVSEITVQFHKDVNISVSDVFVEGVDSGPIPVSLSYDAPSMTATITPLAALIDDTYTVTIADTVTDVAAGLDLDGEVVAAVLPSGDGSAGGEAVFQFTISPSPCPGDIDGDGATNAADFTILAANFGATVPIGTLGDFNHDGVVDAADFTILASNFGCVI